MIPIEEHPFRPFLPENARVLFLGSFPPQQKRWSMKFYYPNFQNDFWRIAGLLFFGSKTHFEVDGKKAFDREKVEEFCREKGLALYDTATRIRRLRDNASDAFLEVVTPTDIDALLREIPLCRAIATTGGRASETIAGIYGCSIPPVGGSISFAAGDSRQMTLYRLPSSSRAYPLSLEKKAGIYGKMFTEIGLL